MNLPPPPGHGWPASSGFYSAQIRLPAGDMFYAEATLWLTLYYDFDGRQWLTLDDYGHPGTVSVNEFVLDWRPARFPL